MAGDDGAVAEGSGAAPDPWGPLRRHTPARVGLGRTGHALPLRHVLDFQLAHAQARDAVHQPVDFAALRAGLAGRPVVEVRSAAADRGVYLRRPDLGRRLDPRDAERLEGREGLDGPEGGALVIVVADGLSATAVHRHALPLLEELWPLLGAVDPSLGDGGPGVPVVLASQARVALGDEIGALLGARLVLVLIGERPGLSAADSLGAYLTYGPRPGRSDAERNCVSNIHPPAGLGHGAAARVLASLLERSLRLGVSGVALEGGTPEGEPGVAGGPAGGELPAGGR
ncbi:ethanolamine ammonia-lyase subunit EutC [uncultured Streptomyces sp.]|uniref:ethanolamine ammonia-lyase subunit EutC n=1 Tax=uncultured Streptomyces sp. TaxID=174707 RepID=UPI0026334F91|nr:ethanolamine ammonia-lyase subunit EutC [uncultured Streptomyces sp.]